MTRGRKKDLSIPPTRALTQQRDYRARKAHYLAELEERCHRVEEENVQLKQEIQALRAGLPIASASLDPQLLSASSALMRDLSAASNALENFQRLAYPETQITSHSSHLTPRASPSPSSISSSSSSSSHHEVSRLRPAFFPSPPCSEASLPPQDILGGQEMCDVWMEEGSRRPAPESHSLRKILCLPPLSEATSQPNGVSDCISTLPTDSSVAVHAATPTGMPQP
ncbi:hypothetical protein EV361DRAFT_36401 [Lentinula raphanica]|uniref:BZIP domain-containing protein n=1 Tax=Lentinula raphanica TaxID=153919 RepID=A0AA38P6U3_9AGAR|nr:hypothetical protein C8R42DRAFT_684145 [Lentinula raphanica]KAJ3820183.1 hypothetical protein F5880DRAFT_994940 [Lentinula raphanica]KAJ3837413.1 hypothetical protein F5878DRAFT_726091 [Lentinula raphanica]KAJ3977428.1 hypothetical protein EV361DRAFT_36401 [Lentinula raphanica]